jgi:hypothetical protein
MTTFILLSNLNGAKKNILPERIQEEMPAFYIMQIYTMAIKCGHVLLNFKYRKEIAVTFG